MSDIIYIKSRADDSVMAEINAELLGPEKAEKVVEGILSIMGDRYYEESAERKKNCKLKISMKAHVVLKMNSMGVEGECSGCDNVFLDGEQMTAVETETGEKLGWFCERCIRTWNETDED